jgi:Tfp pilus assembly protein PilF
MIRAPLLAVALAVPAVVAAQGTVKVNVPLDQLQAAARRDSNDPAAHYNLALGYMSKKRWEPADSALRTALQIDRRFAAAHLAFAYLPYLQRPKLWEDIYEGKVTPEWERRLEEARSSERASYLIDPLVDRRILGAARRRVNWIFNAGTLGEFFNLYFQGLADLEDGKFQDAYGRFNRLSEIVPGLFTEPPLWVYWYRGNAAAQLGNWPVATGDMQRLLDAAVAEEKTDTTVNVPLRTNDYRYILAIFRQKSGDLLGAEQLFKEALDQDLGMYMANVHLAEIYEVGALWDLAVRERERAVQANPDDPSLLIEWGITLGKAGRFADAEQRLLEAIQLQPRDTRAYYWLGIAQQQLGKGPEALATFERFVQLAPGRYERQIAAARQRITQLQ